MLKIKNISNTQGFALHAPILIIVLVSAISFVGGNVYQSQQKQKEAASRQVADAAIKKQQELELTNKATEDAKKITVPAPAAEQKPVEQPKVEPAPAPAPKPAPKPPTTTKPAPTYTTVSIPTTNAEVGTENIVFTAKLPGNYAGYCKVMTKTPDGNNVQYFGVDFGAADTCSVTVSKSKFTAASDWKYYMYFKSSDGKTYGESGGNLFSL